MASDTSNVLADVPRETLAKLEAYVALLKHENQKQNLVSPNSLDDLWSRHIEDSAQLLALAPVKGEWLDIGSGAGLPGIVLAILGVDRICLVEPRRLRTDFLSRCAAELDLRHVDIVTGKAENLARKFDVITARAVASLDHLFEIGSHLLRKGGHWVLPKGRSAAIELAQARKRWQGDFRLEPSMTDQDARILVAQMVRPRGRVGHE